MRKLTLVVMMGLSEARVAGDGPGIAVFDEPP
jgi:hypothetical protein